MDVAAFVGLAERGPICTPIAVTSWEEFQRWFGQPGQGRLLPQSVYLFFANGGRRCVVVRALNYATARTAEFELPGFLGEGEVPIRVFARDPGLWGNEIDARFALVERRVPLRSPVIEQLDPGDTSTEAQLRAWAKDRSWGAEDERQLVEAWADLRQGVDDYHLVIAEESRELEPGACLRMVSPDLRFHDPPEGEDWGSWTPDSVHFVQRVALLEGGALLLRLATPLGPWYRHSALLYGARELRIDAEIVAGSTRERFSDTGLHPRHPAYFLRQLHERSHLLRPSHALWNDALADRLLRTRRGPETVAIGPGTLRPNAEARKTLDQTTVLRMALPLPALRGKDGNRETGREHFFERPLDTLRRYTPPDEDENFHLETWASEERLGAYATAEHAPLDCLQAYDDGNPTWPVSLVTLPDLAHPYVAPEPPLEEKHRDPSLQFGECGVVQLEEKLSREVQYPRLLLATGPHREEVDRYQRLLVQHCEGRLRVAILDLPPELSPGRVLAWRRRHASPHAALYAPYLRCAPVGDPLAPLMPMPPGGVVCGLISRTEQLRGFDTAPANVDLRGVVSLRRDAIPKDSGFLHEARVNEIRATETGLTLLGSRTTSADRDWTHLNVRRTVDYLMRQLPIDAQWATFEPNNRRLWKQLKLVAVRRLHGLYEAGTLQGRTAEQAYFVRVGEDTMGIADLDAGRAIVLVGVAPAVPAEFVVFQLTLVEDGRVRVEERHG